VERSGLEKMLCCERVRWVGKREAGCVHLQCVHRAVGGRDLQS